MSFAITLYCRQRRRHLVGQWVVSDTSAWLIIVKVVLNCALNLIAPMFYYAYIYTPVQCCSCNVYFFTHQTYVDPQHGGVYLVTTHRKCNNVTARYLLSVSRVSRRQYCVHLVLVSSMSFPVTGAKVWNGLPSDVTSASSLEVFKNRLNTYLFRRCYETV